MRNVTTDDALDRDNEWLRRARAGDHSAFECIVRAHQPAAVRLATIVSGDSHEALDIVQDAFVKAHAALGTVRDGDALRPWLMRIVANQAKNARRSRWRREARVSRQAALRPAEPAGPDELALGDIESRRLLAAVATLSRTDRTIIGCRYFAALSEAETATTLGIAKGTVKSRTARALQRLRLHLEADDGASRHGGSEGAA